jgi:hypothetical protein
MPMKLMNVIEEIQNIQRRCAQKAVTSGTNGYSQEVTFDIHTILRAYAHWNIHQLANHVWKETGVSLDPVIDRDTGTTNNRLVRARITGWAKDFGSK